MNYREATSDDALAIASIHTDSWRKNYQSALTEQYLLDVVPKERNEIWIGRLEKPESNQYVVVAEIDSKIIGFVCVYAGKNKEWGSYLDNLHVDSTYQSKGVGKSLLVNAACWCYQQDPNKGMCLLVNQDNLKAQRFYKLFGAHSAKNGVWDAPDGSVVPTYWFVWNSLSAFVKNS